MKYILLLIPLLAVSLQGAFAYPVTQYEDHDLEKSDQNTFVWTSQPTRMLDGGSWINYKYYDTDQFFTFESANGAITFSKDSCNLKLFNPGKVLSGEEPLIPSMTATEKEALDGTDKWQPTATDSARCDFSYSTNPNGVTIQASKSGAVLGVGEEYTTTYDIGYAGKIQITYSHYNGNPLKPNYKYGFTQSLDGDFEVVVGDARYDTGTISSEITFTKADLEGKAIFIKKNGVRIGYDPEDYSHDYLWAMKIKPHHMSVDFTYSKGALGVGKTLVVDPTFGYTTGVLYKATTSAGATTDCGATIANGTGGVTQKDASSGAGNCAIHSPQWNISTIPPGAHITNVNFKVDVSVSSGGINCDITAMASAPETLAHAALYADILDGTVYVNNNSFCATTAAGVVVDLGTSADTSVQTARSSNQGWWAVGLPYDNMSRDGSNHAVIFTTPQLEVTYTFPEQRYENKPFMSDGTTVIGAGSELRHNSTDDSTKNLNSTGYATWTDMVSGGFYNMTVRNLDNFIVNKTNNKSIERSQSQTGSTQIYNVDCSPGADTDHRVVLNFTNYHMLTLTTPVCNSDGDISFTAQFLKQGIGPSTNQTTKFIDRVIDTGEYTWLPGKLTVNGTDKTGTYLSGLVNFTGIQVGNGYTTIALRFVLFTDNVTSVPTALSANGASATSILLSWTAPANTNGAAIQSYAIWRDGSVIKNSTGSTATAYNDNTAGPGGTSHTYRVCAWNRIGCSPYSTAVTGATVVPTTGTATVTTGIIGDVIQANTTVSITHGSPSPVTVSALKLYRNGTLQETKVVSVSIANGSSSSSFDPFWNRMTSGDTFSYKIYATVSNSTGTVQIGSSNFTGTREYDPAYQPALVNPAVEGQVNYTISRFDSDDGILLHVNRVGGTLGSTWTINCISQTNAEARATINQSVNWPGTWNNRSGTGYFNGTWDGFRNTQGYVTCMNPPGILFTTITYTNSSLALFGIEIFDASYGSMLGVPVGIFFLALAGGMANKRTAPTWIVVLLGMAGVMATIGFFTISPIIWGLALVTGLLGLLVNQKVF